MSVVSVLPMHCRGGLDSEGNSTYSALYRVTTNLNTDNFVTVREGSGLPRWGDAFSFGTDTDPWAFVEAIEGQQPDPANHPKVWDVMVKYSTRNPAEGAGAGIPQEYLRRRQGPLDQPWRITGSYTRTTRNAMRDRNNYAITNSAWTPKMVAVPHGQDGLRLEGPSATISLSTRAQAVFHCNSATIWGLTARQLLMTQWQFEIRYYGAASYVWNVLEFEINYDKWDEVFLDEGYEEWLGFANNVKKTILPKNDGANSRPTMLDGNGRILDVSVTPEGVYLTREVIPQFDFLTLGLPNPLPGPFV